MFSLAILIGRGLDLFSLLSLALLSTSPPLFSFQGAKTMRTISSVGRTAEALPVAEEARR